MSIEVWIQSLSIIIALLALFLKRRGMKNYLPVAMFASLYAIIGDYIAKYFKLWDYPTKHYPVRFFGVIEDISIVVDMIVVPIMVMFWVRYSPNIFRKKLVWAIGCTAILTLIEFLIEKFTDALKYCNGYDWYHSFILWLVSWFIWSKFHRWFNKS